MKDDEMKTEVSLKSSAGSPIVLATNRGKVIFHGDAANACTHGYALARRH